MPIHGREDLADERRVESASHLAHHTAEVGLQCPKVDTGRVAREVTDAACDQRHVLESHADRDALQTFEGGGGQATDRSEVEQPEMTFAVDEHVPRVGVGVVEAVVEDLLEERAEESAREFGSVDPARVDRRVVVHAGAGDLVHHQHGRRAERRIHPGDTDVVAGEGGGEPAAGGGLLRVVEFVLDSAHEFVGEGVTPIRRAASTRRSSWWATSRSTEASRATSSATPGRCTLTTTDSPVTRRARCVWPIDAAASGSQSKSANVSVIDSPSPCSSASRT